MDSHGITFNMTLGQMMKLCLLLERATLLGSATPGLVASVSIVLPVLSVVLDMVDTLDLPSIDGAEMRRVKVALDNFVEGLPTPADNPPISL
jgi:hypothetical protein